MFITGTNTKLNADVNNNLQLLVDAASRHATEFINDKSGKVWSLNISNITPAGAGDFFFYIENTGSKSLKVRSVLMSSTAAGIVTIEKVTGTPSFTSGNDVTPVSFRTNSSPSVQATIKTDTNTTGLSSGGVWGRADLDAANKPVLHEIPSTIILSPGGALALKWSAASGALTGIVIISEDDD
jgi:hypothetical protein